MKITLFRSIRKLFRGGRPAPNASAAEVFTDIYRRNRWKDKDSRSGPGSNLAQTAAVRRQLPALLKEIGCRTLLDIPCGDFHWMSRVELPLEHYYGADIVQQLVDANERLHGGPTRSFLKLDVLTDDLPPVDVVFTRDCLVHFPFAEVRRAIANIRRSGAKWLLATTFTEHAANEDIVLGQWRTLNLEAAPFHFPRPHRLINEECTQHNGRYADKCLGLWEVAKLEL